MIKVSIYKNDTDRITGIRLEGHAGFAKAGHDIVCAAVSMLVINTINSIELLTSDGFSLDQDEKKGIIEFHVTTEISHDTAILLDSLLIGLQAVQEEYGKKYLVLKD